MYSEYIKIMQRDDEIRWETNRQRNQKYKEQIEKVRDKIEEIFIILRLSIDDEIEIESDYSTTMPGINIYIDNMLNLTLRFTDKKIEFSTYHSFNNMFPISDNSEYYIDANNEEEIYRRLNTIVERM